MTSGLGRTARPAHGQGPCHRAGAGRVLLDDEHVSAALLAVRERQRAIAAEGHRLGIALAPIDGDVGASLSST